jgi:hypothetical protein
VGVWEKRKYLAPVLIRTPDREIQTLCDLSVTYFPDIWRKSNLSQVGIGYTYKNTYIFMYIHMYVYIDVYIQGSPVENLQNAGTGSAAA